MTGKPRLAVFRDVDVLAALGAITGINTKHYQSDFFHHDIKSLEKAARGSPEDRRLLWMSRLSGTWLFREREVLLRDTAEHHTWLNYGDRLQDRVLAYALEISAAQGGAVRGDIYQLDYPQHSNRIEKIALPTATVTVTLGDGTERSLTYERYCGYKNTDLQPHNHGGIASVRYEPQDALELANLLQEERANRSRCKPAEIERHIKKLAAPEKPRIAEQLALAGLEAARGNAARPAPTAREARHDR